MAMISCPECGNKVSDMAKECKDCGVPIADYVATKRAKAVDKAAIRRDTPGGKILISGTYDDDLHIIVKRRMTALELIINDMVVSERKVFLTVNNISVEVDIADTHIEAVMNGWIGFPKLFVDGVLIEKGGLYIH